MSIMVAIETATDTGSVALGRASDGGLLGEVLLGMRTRHAESLLPALEFLLQTSRVRRRDLGGVVVGAGPGSFTGVRVAAATARGLAHGLAIPLFAYSSLAALALSAGRAGTVCPLLDARRGEVYAACYDVGADGIRATLMEPVAAPVAEVVSRLSHLAPAWVGEGAVRYADQLGIDAPSPLEPRASALLRLALADPAGAGRIDRSAGWEPSYLRASGAERGVRG